MEPSSHGDQDVNWGKAHEIFLSKLNELSKAGKFVKIKIGSNGNYIAQESNLIQADTIIDIQRKLCSIIEQPKLSKECKTLNKRMINKEVLESIKVRNSLMNVIRLFFGRGGTSKSEMINVVLDTTNACAKDTLSASTMSLEQQNEQLVKGLEKLFEIRSIFSRKSLAERYPKAKQVFIDLAKKGALLGSPMQQALQKAVEVPLAKRKLLLVMYDYFGEDPKEVEMLFKEMQEDMDQLGTTAVSAKDSKLFTDNYIITATTSKKMIAGEKSIISFKRIAQVDESIELYGAIAELDMETALNFFFDYNKKFPFPRIKKVLLDMSTKKQFQKDFKEKRDAYLKKHNGNPKKAMNDLIFNGFSNFGALNALEKNLGESGNKPKFSRRVFAILKSSAKVSISEDSQAKNNERYTYTFVKHKHTDASLGDPIFKRDNEPIGKGTFNLVKTVEVYDEETEERVDSQEVVTRISKGPVAIDRTEKEFAALVHSKKNKGRLKEHVIIGQPSIYRSSKTGKIKESSFLPKAKEGNFEQWMVKKQKEIVGDKKLNNTQVSEKLNDFKKTLFEHYIYTAEGLNLIHKAGYAYLDFKTSNLLFHEGKAKISDFDTTVDLESDSHDIVGMGSPPFIAPELSIIYNKKRKNLLKCDQYSFGCFLLRCHCLPLLRVYRLEYNDQLKKLQEEYRELGGSEEHITERYIKQLIPSGNAVNMGALIEGYIQEDDKGSEALTQQDKEILRLIKRLLDPDPKKRFSSMGKVVKELKRIQNLSS